MGSVSRMFRTGGRATVTVCPASCEEAYTGSSLNAANKLSATKLEWPVSISSGRHISVYSDSCAIETRRAEPNGASDTVRTSNRSTIEKSMPVRDGNGPFQFGGRQFVCGV